MFNVNFFKRLTELLPIRKVTTRNKELLQAILSPLESLYNKFLAKRNEIIYKLKFNAQVVYLEHYLNDTYDPTLRRIFIQDKANINYNYLFNSAENRTPIYLYNRSESSPVYVSNDSEYKYAIDYIVKVPSDITFNQIMMRSQINTYNLAGKQFTIETF